MVCVFTINKYLGFNFYVAKTKASSSFFTAFPICEPVPPQWESPGWKRRVEPKETDHLAQAQKSRDSASPPTRGQVTGG